MRADTLLLSSGFEPLKVIPWQRALRLVTLGKVEIVSTYDDWNVRTTTVVIKVPAVVRLIRFFKRRPLPVKFSRASIYTRDRFTCQYCGKKYGTEDLTYDHVVPRAHGGHTNWENIVTACMGCNTRKADRTPEQARMRLLSKPVRPKWLPAVTIRITSKDIPDQWTSWLYWNQELKQE